MGDRLWVRESFHATDIGHAVHYKAKDGEPNWMKWKPSIFMPRWASRILLEITEVRTERLQTITPEDCKAEGINLDTDPFPTINAPDKYLRCFQTLWDSLNTKKGYGWEKNPWCWCLSFKRIEQ